MRAVYFIFTCSLIFACMKDQMPRANFLMSGSILLYLLHDRENKSKKPPEVG